MKFAGDLHACTVHAFVLLNKKEKLRNLQHSARADEPYEVYNILWICLQSMCRTRLNSLSNETTVTCENIVFTARIVAGTWYMAIGGGRDAVARKYVTKPFFSIRSEFLDLISILPWCMRGTKNDARGAARKRMCYAVEWADGFKLHDGKRRCRGHHNPGTAVTKN